MLKYAAETAQICDPHLQHLGVVGGIGGPTRLARRIGTARAKEMIFTGDMIDGQEAFSLGLANKVFPPDKLMPAARELATKIAQMRSVGLRLNKFAVNAAAEMDLVRALRYGYMCAVASQDTAVKAAEAFVEKRKPTFSD